MPEQVTLCSPDEEKTCFACCPPIRPKNYEHIQYRNIVKRILRENTRDFDGESKQVRPIIGFSCWALGYLDNTFKTIGCLLHPARNAGMDLRYRTGYGNKCRRENCRESEIFLELTKGARRFYLDLTAGLDSFEYSSRKHNPLFRLLGWGAYILEKVHQDLSAHHGKSATLLARYPVLFTAINPRASAYVLRYTIDQLGTHAIRGEEFTERFEKLCRDIFAIPHKVQSLKGNTFAHQLGMDRDFQDLIRLGMGIRKIDKVTALLLKEKIDHRLALFVLGSSLGC